MIMAEPVGHGRTATTFRVKNISRIRKRNSVMATAMQIFCSFFLLFIVSTFLELKLIASICTVLGNNGGFVSFTNNFLTVHRCESLASYMVPRRITNTDISVSVFVLIGRASVISRQAPEIDDDGRLSLGTAC
ncbi:hypothetical protein B0T16DRAFT_116022 [Cercophora newfieldiana]|uniref:Uncharacterized protein n=1 Tax=Cercophora newfieldiana TaxID=92897 RepID=A0AA39Y9E3_9PEZI|nr:hypothetical protein B0T16DRAFT_116022 [Cercophora newfieldiana]